MSVLDWVEMNVINVAAIVLVIANHVLPKSSLPDAALAFACAAHRHPLAHIYRR